MSLLPLFLDLRGKRVLVVGGGNVARAKVLALRPTGCSLRVVSLTFAPAFLEALEASGSACASGMQPSAKTSSKAPQVHAVPRPAAGVIGTLERMLTMVGPLSEAPWAATGR